MARSISPGFRFSDSLCLSFLLHCAVAGIFWMIPVPEGAVKIQVPEEGKVSRVVSLEAGRADTEKVGESETGSPESLPSHSSSLALPAAEGADPAISEEHAMKAEERSGSSDTGVSRSGNLQSGQPKPAEVKSSRASALSDDVLEKLIREQMTPKFPAGSFSSPVQVSGEKSRHDMEKGSQFSGPAAPASLAPADACEMSSVSGTSGKIFNHASTESEGTSSLYAVSGTPAIADVRATTTVPAGSVPGASPEETRRSLDEAIQSRLVYPVLARKRGIEGSVVLELVVDAGGQLVLARLAKSSGTRILDDDATRLVESVFESPGKKFNSFSGRVMVTYRLSGGR